MKLLKSPRAVTPWKLCAFASISWVLTFYFFYRTMRRTFTFPYTEQKISLYSENAFYFSFFADIIEAPSFLSGLKLLLYDTRSVYPLVVNAASLYNIYQEVIVGFLWRAQKLLFPFLDGALLFHTPFNFYAFVVIAVYSVGVTVIGITSTYIGGSIGCGIAAIGFFSSNLHEHLISRLSAIPLRENWATAFLWINILSIVALLRSSVTNKSCKNWEISFIFSTFFSLLFWQFTVFFLSTQVAALFATFLLGYDFQCTFQRILSMYLFIYLAVLTAQFFPMYMLTSPFLCLLITAFAIVKYWPKVETMGAEQFLRWMATALMKGITAISVFMLLRRIMKNFAEEDAHVFGILLVNLGLSEHSFDTAIYHMGGTEFRPISQTQIKGLFASKIQNFSSVSYLVCVILCICDASRTIFSKRTNNQQTNTSIAADANYIKAQSSHEGGNKRELRNRKNSFLPSKSSHNVDTNTSEDEDKNPIAVQDGFNIEICYILIQGLLSFLNMVLVSRLRILCLPLLCIISGLLFSPYVMNRIVGYISHSLSKLDYFTLTSKGQLFLKRLSKVWHILLFITAYIPFMTNPPYEKLLNYPKADNYFGSSKLSLAKWLSSEIPEGSGIIADLPTSSLIRVATNISCVVNPHFETLEMRKRVQFMFASSGCPNTLEYRDSLQSRYNTKYMVLNVHRCRDDHREVWGVADKVTVIQSKCPANINPYDRFCYGTMLDNPHFKMVYRNADYMVLEANDEVMDGNKNFGGDFGYDATARSLNIDSWEPWIQRCLRTDPECGQNMCEFSRQMIDVYSDPTVSAIIYKRALELFPNNSNVLFHYGEHLDFDKQQMKDAEEYYRSALQLNPTDLRKASRFSSFLHDRYKNKTAYTEIGNLLIPAIDASFKNMLAAPDKTDLCSAVQLLWISGDSAGNRDWRDKALELWRKLKKVDAPNECIRNMWPSFEGRSLMPLEKLRIALLYK